MNITPTRYSYYWVDVFTEQAFGGNPLVVFPHAEGLDPQTMQQIAREFNTSETTFVLPGQNHTQNPDSNTYTVRIFTPGQEIPFAGHPSLGTAWVLKDLHSLKSEEVMLIEGVGEIPVRFCSDGSLELESSVTPKYQEMPLSQAELADFLGVKASDIGLKNLPPEIVFCGLPYALVPLGSLQAIQSARYNWAEDHPLLEAHPHLRELYLICPETEDPSVDYHVRMFAPHVGVPEDPATGSAAATLGAYLMKHRPQESTWQLEQGLEMGRPSRLHLRRNAGQIFVRGFVRPFAKGEIEI